MISISSFRNSTLYFCVFDPVYKSWTVYIFVGTENYMVGSVAGRSRPPKVGSGLPAISLYFSGQRTGASKTNQKTFLRTCPKKEFGSKNTIFENKKKRMF